jgi:diacylglycerol kinase (ATP)
MLRTQANFVVHLAIASAAMVLGIALRLTPAELAIIVLTITFVLVVECLNTALETLCDLVSPSFHPLVKRTKDVSAAAVLIGAVGSVLIGILLFVPHLGVVK